MSDTKATSWKSHAGGASSCCLPEVKKPTRGVRELTRVRTETRSPKMCPRNPGRPVKCDKESGRRALKLTDGRGAQRGSLATRAVMNSKEKSVSVRWLREHTGTTNVRRGQRDTKTKYSSTKLVTTGGSSCPRLQLLRCLLWPIAQSLKRL